MPIGKIEPFNLNAKQWPAYVRRVNQFMLLNEIKTELKVSTLITVVGEETYNLMCDLCAPKHPEEKTYEELVELVRAHLEPQRSEIAERHIFRQRRQKAGESLTEYLQALKHLAVTCNFGTRLEEDLRDQFVSGLASELMRSRIFTEKAIDYRKAVELALALEAAERHAEASGVSRQAATGSTDNGGGAATEGLHAVRARRGGGAGAGGARGPPQDAAGRGARGYVRDGAECWRCGKGHAANRCRFANYNCDNCNQRGHLRVMCVKVRDRLQRSEFRQNFVEECSEEDAFFNLVVSSSQGNDPYFINIKVNSEILKCEIDTGSRISAINSDVYELMFKDSKLLSDNLILRSYSGSRIEPLVYILVNIQFKSVSANNVRLYVIKGGGLPLLGRDWLKFLKITQINMNKLIEEDQLVSQLCKEYPQVFTDKLGTCKKTLRLQLVDCNGVYVRARPVPLALRERVERELERLQRDGSIYRVDHSDFGTPIVAVVKSNGELRICGDYKVTINPILKRDHYPLPRIEELFAKLCNGDEFTKIDLRHAYEQILLEPDSQKFTTITTHVGTFAYRRTPYGLSCVPEQFQKIMEETLHGIPGTVVFLDDICITGGDRHAHMRNLRAALDRLRLMGLTVKLEKCSFLTKSVKYLGFIIDKNGLHPDPDKLDAISRIPTPTDVTQLKSFLGLLNYYGKFIPNLSSLLHPLHNLLKKDTPWDWNSQCIKAFEKAKTCLLSDKVLAHYEEGRPLVLSVDSSAYGVGAVLAHSYPDGGERPVSCASRTLNEAERNYSQLDKEALAIYYGVLKHHQYLFGRRFTLRSDHKPLTYIFGDKKGIPQTAASRLQRWAARLAAYDFDIQFVRSADNGPADTLSRLPLSHERLDTPQVDYLNFVQETVPIDFIDVSKETRKDTLLSKVLGYIMFGWPSSPTSEEEKIFFARRQDLFTDRGCIIYKYRVVIPYSLQSDVLKEIHSGHLGMNKMKNIARNYVYWPNIDKDIEEMCRACEACRTVRDAPAHAPLHPWEYPLHPWQRIHIDFFDCAGKRFLIVVDAHSKWIETVAMNETSAGTTIRALRSIFARFGIPSQLVSDNGPPFFSAEFKEYCVTNKIRHSTSAPYRPQGNGEAENAVKTVKKAIKRAIFEKKEILTALYRFLFQYRNCEHATTGVSPAVAMFGRRLRGRLDALRPDTATVVAAAQDKQIVTAGGQHSSFSPGEPVLARDYSKAGNKWAKGHVSEVTGPISYKVKLGDGTEWRRHHDQIIPLTNKNRYSLSRASSVLPSEEEAEGSENNVGRSEIMSEGTGSGESSAQEKSNSEDVFEDAVEVTTPSEPGLPLPPDASERAKRAHRRAHIKENN
ncbi:uncharacterized protein K02A2.6-like [Plodia interpunctella]|uniref:uncharacterized protein K02A2.6-like n=1 Tax=Plodia interpunctella TaxID=58824 RepID=UPI002368EEFE|nr:uncharacterized protein K02A2.6-like [Plodia interpunctella]